MRWGGRRAINRSETFFAPTADGLRIAYQVMGAGPGDLIYVPAWVSHVERNWLDPSCAAFLRHLTEGSRLVVFDKRGTGLSDRVGSVPDLETRMGDLQAVMDACRIDRAVLFGVSSGAAMAALYAATFCRRVRGLIMYAPRARARWAPDYPWGMRAEDLEAEIALIRDGWDSGDFVRSYVVPHLLPSRVGDEAFAERLAGFFRAGCSMEDAVAMSEMWWETDFRAVLSSICVPTLLIGNEASVDETAYVAERIPGARQVTVPGADALLWGAGTDQVADAILRFVSEVGDEEALFDRVLATVLFTDIVDSTARAAAMGDRRWSSVRNEHDTIVRSHLNRFGGREIKTMGDGFLAAFDGPARAIRCGKALVGAVHRLGIEIRAGVHTGEVELTNDDVAGLTVAIGARVAERAGPSEVLVSQTVRDLVAGSGLAFEDSGQHDLKGVPGPWHLFRVAS